MENKKKRKAKPSPRPYFFLLSLLVVLLILIIIFLEGIGTADGKTAEGGAAPVAEVPQGVEEAAPAAGYSDPAPEKPPQDADGAPPVEKTQGIQRRPPEDGEAIPPVEAAQGVQQNQGKLDIPPVAPPKKAPEEAREVLVFVIDDVGNNLDQLERFLEFPGPITFAVMPQRPHTAESIRRIRAAGKAAIIHQPMEPMGETNPGKGALYVSMTQEDIWKVLDENLQSTGPVIGMNNHMGSRVTGDSSAMKAVLTYLKRRDMVFLDSATTAAMVGAPLALELGTTYIKRNSMFLDNESDKQSIFNAIQEGKKVAKKSGHAVMIGHVMTDELAELLFELYPSFIEDGFTLEDLSGFLRGDFDAGSRG